jgi:imidazole glycerol-phosphate synthase subunit HisH
MIPIKLVIIDYGMGNLRSVANAFEVLGCLATISNNPADLFMAEGIVLPGVGAFGDGIKNLQDGGWVDSLEEEVIQKHKPFLGICLGMQLLATTGTEHGVHKGLNWIPGFVKKIPSEDPKIRVPHIGWNDVCFTKKDSLYTNMGDSQAFYFVHSYMFIPENPTVVSGVCSYGVDFAASVEIDNIFATQFHPEKSHKVGLEVLKNFLKQLDRS